MSLEGMSFGTIIALVIVPAMSDRNIMNECKVCLYLSNGFYI